LKNVENLNQADQLDFRKDYSHNVLPELLNESDRFEFVFIDGDHKLDGQMVDFYYADLLLEDSGYVLLHDTWMRSTRLLMAYIDSNRTNYKSIPTGLRNLALYQKLGADDRNGMHFKEFYTVRSILSHHGILYMTTGKSNMFKRFLFKLKDLIK